MLIARLGIVMMLMLFVILIANVVLPYVSPQYAYWWMFKKNKLTDAKRDQLSAKQDIEVDKIEESTEKMKQKHSNASNVDNNG